MSQTSFYLFFVLSLSLSCLSISSHLVGTSLVYQNKSQLADLLGHAGLPGFMLAYLVSQSTHPSILLLGGIGSALVAAILLASLETLPGFHSTSIMAVLLSSFLGIGLMIQASMQGNPAYPKLSQAGLNTFLIGQASYLVEDDLLTLSCISVLVMFVFLYDYQDIQYYLFDPHYTSLQVSHKKTKFILQGLVLVTTIGAIQVMGALLVGSLLIFPTLIVQPWIKTYKSLLWIGSLLSLVVVNIGSWISTCFDGFATGPSIVLTFTLLGLASLGLDRIIRKLPKEVAHD